VRGPALALGMPKVGPRGVREESTNNNMIKYLMGKPVTLAKAILILYLLRNTTVRMNIHCRP
jgi:hypothetical protein